MESTIPRFLPYREKCDRWGGVFDAVTGMVYMLGPSPMQHNMHRAVARYLNWGRVDAKSYEWVKPD